MKGKNGKKANHQITVVFRKNDLHNPLSANHKKWSNTVKQFVGNLPTNCLSMLDRFVELELKR